MKGRIQMIVNMRTQRVGSQGILFVLSKLEKPFRRSETYLLPNDLTPKKRT